MVEIVGGASVTSKSPKRMLTGLKTVNTAGCRAQLEDGRWYRDWQMSLAGPIYGYAPSWWRSELMDALMNGPGSSIAHRDERVVAEMLGGFYPVESVRFMLNGSDPNAAAVKLSRAVTGRENIVCVGYHGTSSAFAKQPPRRDEFDQSLGTTEAERGAYYHCDWLGDTPDVPAPAALFLECDPHPCDRTLAGNWLHAIIDLMHDLGGLVVLDEVVTGFRYGPGGAAEYYQLRDKVDLFCFGKTLGNGYPVAALGGKRDIMQWLVEAPDGSGRVHWSNTFNGEPFGLAAARATLRQLRTEPLPWPYIYDLGEYLKERWNALGLPWQLVGHPTRPVIDPQADLEGFDDLRRALFERGHIVVPAPWYVTTAHARKDVDDLVEAGCRN